MINKIRYLLLLFAVSFSISIQAQTKLWTLEECVNYAIQNNITVQQSTLETKSAAINRTAAIGGFLPNINANASHSWNIGLNQNITTGLLENQTTQFSQGGLSANVVLYNGLQNQNRLRRANLSIIASQYQLTKIQNDISLNVANAFLQILFNKENLKVQNEQLSTDQKQLQRNNELVNGGAIPRGDLLDSKALVAADNQKVIIAENALFISKLSLAQLLQLSDFKNFDIADNGKQVVEKSSVLLQTPETIIEKARQDRVELKLAKANLAVAEKDISIAKGAYQPTLAGFYNFSSRVSDNPRVTGFEINAANPTSTIGQVQGTGQNVIRPNVIPIFGGPDAFFNQFSNNKGQNFGFQLSIPILNGFAVKTNVQRAKIEYERSQIATKQADLDLERNVYNAINDAKGALNAYESSIIAFEARKEALNYAKEKFNVGMMNSFTLNQSQTLYANAESEVLRTKYDYIFKVKVVEFYFGIPLSTKQ